MRHIATPIGIALCCCWRRCNARVTLLMTTVGLASGESESKVVLTGRTLGLQADALPPLSRYFIRVRFVCMSGLPDAIFPYRHNHLFG